METKSSSPIRGIVFSIVSALAIIAGTYLYWQHQSNYPSTTDAQIKGDKFDISPQISGKVAKVYIKNNQLVKTGDKLIKIDNRSLKLALAKAKANLNSAKNNLDSL